MSPKSKAVAAILAFFLGSFGVHRFYLGKVGTGILIIFTCGGFFGIWPFVDFIMILCGKATDSNGLPVKN